MEMVLRAAAIYLILLIIFKIAGRRTLMQLTNFDLILLLIISEATQQAMLSTDYSVTGSMLTIVTTVSIDILFGYIKKKKFAQAENFLDGTPVIVVENGAVIDEKIKLVNISVDDILLAAVQHHGIYELKAIKFAILERNGQISIIPEQE
ncbi:DUF421 domain-containing protein [Klebsiella pneumoniae]|uniref:DUF421 domain-containing protein n=1 Tax=Klebsiella pneumoniae TaxID=573 RepID=A0A5C2LJ65_KLEPN|nr:DUF421 domain-containing protein [Klebsiella pneumoniae]